MKPVKWKKRVASSKRWKVNSLQIWFVISHALQKDTIVLITKTSHDSCKPFSQTARPMILSFSLFLFHVTQSNSYISQRTNWLLMSCHQSNWRTRFIQLNRETKKIIMFEDNTAAIKFQQSGYNEQEGKNWPV